MELRLVRVSWLPLIVLLVVSILSVVAYGASVKEVQEHAKAMSKDAEDMVAHGGMGDAKAIVHHCQEVVRHAEAILKDAPPTDPHSKEAAVYLEEAIRQCQRVAKFGEHVDPGVTLNPGTKARAAVREAVKHLSLLKDDGLAKP